MKKRFGLATLALGSILAVAAPTVASARDRDDWGRRGEHERHEMHERMEHRYYGGRSYGGRYYYGGPRVVIGGGYYTTPYNGYSQGYANGYSNGYNNGYQNGYYDSNGVWHYYNNQPQQQNGYYDQYGNWVPYGY